MTHNSRSLILNICDSGDPVVAYFANILAREHDGGTECAHDQVQILFLIFFDVAVVILCKGSIVVMTRTAKRCARMSNARVGRAE